ncbi:MAG TPA: hypothetical protein VFT56_09515 [Sphingomonas sp.]|nr:hypothetical protein [Sphingomonas sp.]
MLDLIATAGTLLRPVPADVDAPDGFVPEHSEPKTSGDADLAQLLVEVGRLVDADALGLIHVAGSGRIGATLASAILSPCAEAPRAADLQPAFDGLEPGSVSREDGDLALALLKPRPNDRVLLYAVAGTRRLAPFAPLIERGLALWMKAHVERLMRDDQHAVLNRLASAVLIVDVEGQIQFANRAAQTVLDSASDVFEADGRLMLRDVEQAMQLQLMLRHLLARATEMAPAGRSLVMAVARPGRFPLVLALEPLGLGEGRPRAAVQLIDVEGEPHLPLEAVGGHFDLTAVERRLVDQLVRGRTLAEAAEAMRLKEQTARTYLKQVFQKTGLRRQADLVGAMLRAALPLSA